LEVRGAVVVITGGGDGIGRALCERFAAEGARVVVVADRDEQATRAVAGRVDGHAVVMDAASEPDVVALLDEVVERFGPPDLFCANAGTGADGGLDATDEVWERSWRTNCLSHVFAARHCVPLMVEHGGGYLLHTASAAGLLSMPGALPYAAAKHAAVAVAEYVAYTYRDCGIRVSCLCPQAVDTALLREQTQPEIAQLMRSLSTVLDPATVAAVVVEGLRREQFLILPHAEVADHVRRRATDTDRWLAGMARLAPMLGPAAPAAHAHKQAPAEGGRR
jgi:NAD(P)-dependent dehydrogenase (short-subunit alcohol dehydrogenase family)